MILVVMHHVSGFCLESYLNKDIFTFHSIFSEFRMPLFFFVSGFVFYKDRYWDYRTICSFFKKKIPVQIITPTIFMSISCYIHNASLLDTFLAGNKGGYWFTFVLFDFYCIYILLSYVMQFSHFLNRKHYVVIMIGVILYILTVPQVFLYIPVNRALAGFMGIGYWRLFIFFALGTLAKYKFAKFQDLLDGNWLVPTSVCVFLLSNVFHDLLPSYTLRSLICQFSGIIMVFSFFRRYQKCFTARTRIGNMLQYIGKRTLDIYLIHYFLLPYDIKSVFSLFSHFTLAVLELFVSFSISILVIGMSLIIGNILRINPKMEYRMWGTKQN